MPRIKASRVKFWLLDINFEMRLGTPEIWLWGICNGERVLLLEREFKPYFYLVISDEPGSVLPALRSESLKTKEPVEFQSVERNFFGRPVKAIKVICSNPETMGNLAQRLSKVKGIERSLEEDIRFSTRYVIDTGVTPCSWHVANVRRADNPPRVIADEVYSLVGPPEKLDEAGFPRLRVMSFHVVPLGGSGGPQPGKDPVAVISVNNSRKGPRQFYMGDGDREVLISFIEYVKGYDPDIIVGYGVNQGIWQVLMNRAKHHGLKLAVDRASSEPHTSLYGHTSITGRAGLDLLDMAKEIPSLDVERLDNFARYLGLNVKGELMDLEETDISDLWASGDKQLVLKYAAHNAQIIAEAAESLLVLLTQFSDLVKLPLDHVVAAAVGFRVESYLMAFAHRAGELIPKRISRDYAPYAGGLVLNPKPGMHKDIAVIDFRSMYPNLMIKYNISPDTYTEEPAKDLNVAPEVGYGFRKSPDGFYKQALKSLVAARGDLATKLKGLSPRTTEYRLFEARQRAIKIITNAMYGYCGWVGARWYAKSVAEATAAWGRSVILRSIELAKSAGLEVMYGDTDSIFLRNDPVKVAKVLKAVGEEIGLEARPEKVYKKLMFTEAKKRYCGLLSTGEIDIVGLEAIRGDWAGVAKKAQKKLIEIILREEDVEKATAFVRQCVAQVLKGDVPKRDLVIWKTLTKPAEEYEVKAPHVEAAKIMKEKGWQPNVGDKIGYIVVKGDGKLYQRVRPFAFMEGFEPDYRYYAEKQVVPAAARVLSIYKVDESALLA